jgi:hypothetical protein
MNENKGSRWWLLLLLLFFLEWWFWWRKPFAVSIDTRPAPTGQGANLGQYATRDPAAYAQETRDYLNTIVYIDPVSGAWASGSSFTGLYDAWLSLRDSGRDTSACLAQMESAIRAHFPGAQI